MTLVAPAPATADRTLSATDANRLRAAVRGRVITAGDGEYDALRRGHNLAVDRFPAAIVRPSDARDVARAVLAGRELGLEIAVRGGGHSIAGHSVNNGGMVIDLGDMRAVEIDPVRRVGTAQGGVTAGEYTVAAHEHGLATPFGDTTSVGLGGLTLGGGIGWLVRKHGLTIDSLLSVDLVTADGRALTVSEDSDPELFWALRGGGGNFGIATRFRYRLHPVGRVTGGALFLPLTREVLLRVAEVAAAAPEELSTITFAMGLPPAPFVPEALVGTPAAVVMLVHAGGLVAGEGALAPFRAITKPILDLVGPMPYPAIYQLTDGGSQPGPAVVRSTFLARLDEAAADAIVARHASAEGRLAMTQLRVLGGAMARVPSDATAFAHRDAPVMATLIRTITGSADEATAWTEAFLGDISGTATGVYANFLADEGEGRLREAYPRATWHRLAQVKRRLDPDNVFRGNHNILPA